MSERVIVAMDGSTPVSTAALLAKEPGGEWRALARRAHTDSRGQARVLLRLLDEMLQEIGRTSQDIGALVTGSGPGTFTGVRIAVATARALGLALNVPVVGISTLSALAAEAAEGVAGAAGAVSRAAGGAAAAPEVIVPVVDARRGQVFFGVYRRVESGFARTEALGVVDRDALFSVIPAGPGTLVVGDIAALGEGAAAAGGGAELRPMEVRAEYLVAGQEFLSEPGDGIEGARLGAWLVAAAEVGSSREWKPGEPGSPESVKPIYVRTPDADIHITKMRDPWADAGGSATR